MPNVKRPAAEPDAEGVTPPAAEQPAVVEIENGTKVFRDFWRRPKVRAVNGIDLAVRPGEVFGLLGPNGSGKSTTIKMILGLLYPTRGRIRVFGRSPRDVRAKARIGYLPEESYLYGYLTSEETLDFYGKLFDQNRRMRRERTEQLLEMIGLRHARRRAVGEFSKGMARRIGLAQALINDPDLVVLDEPTAGLDPIGCRQVKDLILTLAGRGKTVIVCSHLLADVEDVCDRIAILFEGRIQARGRVRELLEEPDTCRMRLPSLPPERLKRVLALLREEIGAEPEVDHPRRNLEQFFLDVVKRAQADESERSGVRHSEAIPAYLAEEPKPQRDILDRLVQRDS
ncbi:MAG: ABC transporter ATP-binding protein [Kiritimatiellae bacterium]|nr:ABC transporter ATP-binding protein [Kiritimatiellia bacterium]